QRETRKRFALLSPPLWAAARKANERDRALHTRRTVRIVAAHARGVHFVEQYRVPPPSIPFVHALKKRLHIFPKDVRSVVIDALNNVWRKMFPARRRKRHARRVRSPAKRRHLKRNWG